MTNETKSLLMGLERVLMRVCGKLGHLLTNVETGHARCRICRVHIFCSHASHEQLSRYLLGSHNTTSNLGNVTVTYTKNPPTKDEK